LAKEHANKPRVVAAVDAESDIDVESSVPVVKFPHRERFVA